MKRLHIVSAVVIAGLALAAPASAQLAGRLGDPVTREELSDMGSDIGASRVIDIQMTRLRKKIEDDPKFPRYLQTVRGRGYVLQPD